ncbi:MAG: hypothetical protein J2P41_19420, partial [Blastocatellia bacterium]|nr:hypothetical protein [Blastocatellia bacterium]
MAIFVHLAPESRKLIVAASLGLLLFWLTTCAARSKFNGSTSILLFDGSGTSPDDVEAIEKILDEDDFSYTTANSRQFNEI